MQCFDFRIAPCGLGIVNIFRTTKVEVYLDTHLTGGLQRFHQIACISLEKAATVTSTINAQQHRPPSGAAVGDRQMTMRRPDAAPGHTRTHARTQPRPQAAPPPAARRHYTSAHTDRHMAHGASRQPAACATRDAVLRHTRTHARTQPHPRNSTATNSKRRRQTAVGSRTCGLERHLAGG